MAIKSSWMTAITNMCLPQIQWLDLACPIIANYQWTEKFLKKLSGDLFSTTKMWPKLSQVYGRPFQVLCMAFSLSLWTRSICVQLQGKEATSTICLLRTEHLFFLCLQRRYLRHSLGTRSGGLPGTRERSSTACEQVWHVNS